MWQCGMDIWMFIRKFPQIPYQHLIVEQAEFVFVWILFWFTDCFPKHVFYLTEVHWFYFSLSFYKRIEITPVKWYYFIFETFLTYKYFHSGLILIEFYSLDKHMFKNKRYKLNTLSVVKFQISTKIYLRMSDAYLICTLFWWFTTGPFWQLGFIAFFAVEKRFIV